MPRRFQFSLKTLLWLTATVCLLLGARHLLETYGRYMKIGNIALGESIAIRGQVIHLFGPPKIYVEIQSYNLEAPSLAWTSWGWLERSWLCRYDFNETALIDTPGDWVVEASELDW